MYKVIEIMNQFGEEVKKSKLMMELGSWILILVILIMVSYQLLVYCISADNGNFSYAYDSLSLGLCIVSYRTINIAYCKILLIMGKPNAILSKFCIKESWVGQYYVDSSSADTDEVLKKTRVSILAFHEALVEQPRDALVVAAFSLAVYTGGYLSEAVDIARGVAMTHDSSFCEISEHIDLDSKDALMDEVISLAASVKAALRRMRDERFVSQALAEYPQAPKSDLVFIPYALSIKVCSIFDCVERNKNKGFIPKQVSEIDYDSLALGKLHEVRRTFGRVVFDTLYPPKLVQP